MNEPRTEPCTEPRPDTDPEGTREAPETAEATMMGEERTPETTEPEADAATLLAAREAAISERERRLMAREAMQAKGLPMELLTYFDYSSNAALENSIALASLVALAWPVSPAPMPKQSAPPVPAFATYLERASLFKSDPIAYRELASKSEKT